MDAIAQFLFSSGLPAGFVLLLTLGAGVIAGLLRDRSRLISCLNESEKRRDELQETRVRELREALRDARLFERALERMRGRSYNPGPTTSRTQRSP